MFLEDTFVVNLLSIVKRGVIVCLKETIDDYDHENDTYYTVLINSRLFKYVNGKIYCKGGSVMYPPPNVYDDGWEIEPLADPYDFFINIIDEGCLEKVCVCDDDKEIAYDIWTNQEGWMNGDMLKESMCPRGLKQSIIEGMTQDSLKKNKPLKVLCAMVALETLGPLKLSEYAMYMDYEVYQEVFKPVAWWISV
jgi:hypothetical protein